MTWPTAASSRPAGPGTRPGARTRLRGEQAEQEKTKNEDEEEEEEQA